MFVTTDGRVKILDFGLAKVLEALPDGGRGFSPGGHAGSKDPASIASETALSPTPTASGVILGTVGYMAPEQIRGQAVDARTDIFAFGCVLYEMLAGRRAFSGETPFDTLSAILKDTPAPVASHAPDGAIAPPLARIVERCLEKVPAARFQSAADLAFALREVTATSGMKVAAAHQARASKTWLPWAIATIAVATAAVAVAALTWWPTNPAGLVPTSAVQRFTLPITETMVALFPGYLFDLSPDGSRIAYVAEDATRTPHLFVRNLDSGTSGPLAPTRTNGGMSFSPDSEWVVFSQDDGQGNLSLNKVRIDGGLPVRLTGLPGPQYGRHWAADQTIIYSAPRVAGILLGTLWRVPAAGGTPVVVADPDPARGERGFNAPSLLPDGSVLFVMRSAWSSRIAVLPHGRPPAKVLIEEAREPRFVAPGFLLFVQGSELMAVPFDLERLEVAGTAVPLVDGLPSSALSTGYAAYRLSSTGTLVYLAGTPEALPQRVPQVVDRQGRVQASPPFRPDNYLSARLAPNGRTVALGLETRSGAQYRRSVQLVDLERGTLAPLTEDGAYPGWTPDGGRAVFQTSQGALRLRAADLSGPEQALPVATDVGRIDLERIPTWSPDGANLMVTSVRDQNQGLDLFKVPGLADGASPSGPVPLEPFLVEAGHQSDPAFSPDGRYVAYVDALGLYVRPFPGPGPVTLVSNGPVNTVRWAGTELIFVQNRQVTAVTISTTPTVSVGRPQVLFTLPPDSTWSNVPPNTPFQDVSRDGQRFLLLTTVSTPAPQPPPREFRVIINFVEEMKRKVAAGQ